MITIAEGWQSQNLHLHDEYLNDIQQAYSRRGKYMRHIILAIAFGGFISVGPALASNEGVTVPEVEIANPDQKIKCRRVDVTGSLVKRGRVCKTVAQWRAIIDNNNELARKLVEDGTTRYTGN